MKSWNLKHHSYRLVGLDESKISIRPSLSPIGVNSYITGFGQEFASMKSDAVGLKQAVDSQRFETSKSIREMDQIRLQVKQHLKKDYLLLDRVRLGATRLQRQVEEKNAKKWQRALVAKHPPL